MKIYIAFRIALALLLVSLCNWTAAAQENRDTLIEKVRRAVVAVTVFNDKDEMVDQVSGFFISKEGHLLSCRHVLRGASRVEVQTREGKVCAVTRVIADDPDLDLIVLLTDLPEGEMPYLRMTDVSTARAEQVTVFGYQQIVQGMVSCVRRPAETGQTFEFLADSHRRATGGPVVNKDGDVIAIATEQPVDDQVLTLAVGSRRALAMVPAPTTFCDWNTRIKGEPAAAEEGLFFAGANLVLSGEYARALSFLEEAIRRNPHDAEARLNCGYAKARLQRCHEAMQDYEEALRIEPGYPDALNNLGAMYHQLGRFQEAVGMYQQAIKLKPDYAQAYTNLGATYDRLGRYEEAISANKQAIEILPMLAAAHNNLGMVYLKVGRHEEAIQSLRRTVQLQPDFAEAFNGLGIASTNLGWDQEASEAFQHAIRIKPDFADAFNNLGFVESKLGLFEQAVESFRKAIQLRPDSVEAYYNLGVSCDKLGRDQCALEALQQAMRIKPDFAEAANQLGIVYYRTRRYDDSIQSYRQAIQIRPNFAEAHYNLGMLYLTVGDHQSAFVVYGELKNLNRNLASDLFDAMKKRYTVRVSASTSGANGRPASPRTLAAPAAIQHVIDRINGLLSKGALRRGLAEALIAQLQIAGSQADTGNEIMKINLLHTFTERVSSLINAQEISEQDGQPLIDGINAIINRLLE